MVEESAVIAAKVRIERVLADFAHNGAETKVVVVMDELGHLHAIVATCGFEGIPPRERQDRVRAHLRDHARPEDLAHLYRISTMTPREYDEWLLSVGNQDRDY